MENKKQIIQRKSVYSQLNSKVENLTEALEDRDGTIETLQRQLVQAGIKHKIDVADKEVYKETVDTEAQQKLYKKLLKKDYEVEKDAFAKNIERLSGGSNKPAKK